MFQQDGQLHCVSMIAFVGSLTTSVAEVTHSASVCAMAVSFLPCWAGLDQTKIIKVSDETERRSSER